MKKKDNEFSKHFGLNGETSGNKKYSDMFVPEKNSISENEIKTEYTDVKQDLDIKKSLSKNLPKITEYFEKKLKANHRELSLIEGNLIDSKIRSKTIYCSSCFPEEGKTVTAISMSYGLSQFSRKKVLLVDCNTNNPSVHTLFGIENNFGFQEVLNEKAELSNVIIPTAYENLYIITAGNETKSIDNSKLENILNILKYNFDYVIMDGYAVYEISEPLNIASKIDGYILTVKCESTKWEIVQMVKDKLINAGGKVYGVVLNKRKFYISPLIYKIISKKRKNV